jgi:hypothetical protein
VDRHFPRFKVLSPQQKGTTMNTSQTTQRNAAEILNDASHSADLVHLVDPVHPSSTDPQPSLHDERAKLLNLLAVRFTARSQAVPEKNSIAENPQPAKQTLLNPETHPKQARNEPETDPKYFTPTDPPSIRPSPSRSSPTSHMSHTSHASPSSGDTTQNQAQTINLEDLPLPLQSKILELIDSSTLDSATLQITTRQPYGLGIKTNRSALYWFHKKHEAAKLAAHRDEAGRHAAELLKNADATDADFSRATQHLIKLRLLETAMCEKTDANAILALSKSLDRLRAADHAERRLQLAEKKAEPQNKPAPSNSAPISV